MSKTQSDLFNLSGKTAVITGSGQGIGKGIAEGLAQAGANIVLGEINTATMNETGLHIKQTYGVDVLEVPLDVTQEGQIKALMEATVNRFGSLDILVNNAGIVTVNTAQDMTMDQWDRTVDINLRAVFMMCKNAHPYLKKSGNGKIINIASIYATFGAQYLAAYAASKSGVVQLTKSLAIGWAEDNIQVNSILPGWINTPMSIEGRKENPAAHDEILARTPAGRWGNPDDLAGTSVFLASKASQYVTGVAIPVDGGYSVF